MKKYSKEKLANSYAQAIMEASPQVDETFADAQKMLKMLNEDANIIKYLSNPLWAVSDKKSAFDDVLKHMEIGQRFARCLDVVADNNRFDLLKEILQNFEKKYYIHKKITKVIVVSVVELSDKQKERLHRVMENQLNNKIILEYKIEPSILGGLRLEYGSNMIDDTIKAKLEKLSLLMKGAK